MDPKFIDEQDDEDYLDNDYDHEENDYDLYDDDWYPPHYVEDEY